MHDLLEKQGPGKGSFLKSDTVVRPEKRAEYFKLITDAQNFFKHADREPANAVLEFYPEPIAFSLLDVVDMATPGATTRTRSCSSCGSA